MLEIIFEKEIQRLKINRPEVKNAMNSELIEKLTEAVQSVSSNKSIKLLQLEGSGEVFSAGADLNYMQSMIGADQKKNLYEAEKLHALFKSIEDCPVPVVCLVQGAAFGGALGLMAASDYVVADANAKICFSEVKLGIAPAVISEFVLKKAVNSQVVPFMLSGMIFSAQEALVAGLVQKIAVNQSLESAAQSFKESVLTAGPLAVRSTKKLIQELRVIEPNQIRKLTTHLIAELRVSPEGQEGLRSFLEKRKPNWAK
ncbi:MAG: enoyl-CoA hydratase-related protein [Bdellovibrionales bacterium]